MLAVAVVMLASPSRAPGIVGGQPDGNQHPNVGMLAGYDQNGLAYICSGALIAPTVYLTAAHCLPGAPEVGTPTQIRVSFAPSFDLGSGPSGPVPIVEPALLGTTSQVHPAHDGTAPLDAAFVSSDLGVLVLDRPAADVFPGVQPMPLAPLGSLESVRQGDTGGFSVVGYGVQAAPRPGEPGFGADFMRRMASVTARRLVPPSVLVLTGIPDPSTGSGVGCSGDSGGPVLKGSVLVGVISGSDVCRSDTFGPRLDTPSARNFLSRFVSLP